MGLDSGTKLGVTTDQTKKLKELERENRELKRANEVLRKASAFFAAAEPKGWPSTAHAGDEGFY